MKQKAMYTCRHREEQSKEQNGSIWSNVNCCSQVHVRNSPSENSFKSPCKRKNCVKTSISSYKSGRCQMILRNLEERSWYKIQVIIRTKTFVLERAKRQCNLKIKVWILFHPWPCSHPPSDFCSSVSFRFKQSTSLEKANRSSRFSSRDPILLTGSNTKAKCSRVRLTSSCLRRYPSVLTESYWWLSWLSTPLFCCFWSCGAMTGQQIRWWLFQRRRKWLRRESRNAHVSWRKQLCLHPRSVSICSKKRPCPSGLETEVMTAGEGATVIWHQRPEQKHRKRDENRKLCSVCLQCQLSFRCALRIPREK